MNAYRTKKIGICYLKGKRKTQKEVILLDKPIILFDEQCYLCRQSKRIISKIDWFNQFKWLSLQQYERNQQLTSVQKDAIKSEMHLIKKNGEVLVGFFAIRYILLHCPLTALAGLVSYVPKSDVIGNPMYRLVARNRYQLFKNKCDNGVCRIPSK
ncbi:thiol-disulfide oxidoreductase DCC family protein [Aquibacillus rhizosphaerae]|uniref:DUF393 domain-containing protein n=1 Tax=Aquibacillus rhizosphaerae TaxID=3051431 RepID=A0ABT7LBE1_9BACI|nr:DUF393 domain-containing protein [Aquibacillus sp. LR5S19]MDL4842572.1 DUF393 domain-containing protein [Aquibacillus sp. LR5S19]